MGPLKHQHRSLFFFAGENIFKACKNEDLRKILDKSAMKQLKIVLIISALLFFGLIVFLALPIYFIFVNGERIILISAVMPFTNVYSDWGYSLNILNMSIMAYIIAFLNIGADLTFAVIINNMWAGLDVVKFSMKEMESLLKHTDNKTEKAAKFRNILIQIQDLDR